MCSTFLWCSIVAALAFAVASLASRGVQTERFVAVRVFLPGPRVSLWFPVRRYARGGLSFAKVVLEGSRTGFPSASVSTSQGLSVLKVNGDLVFGERVTSLSWGSFPGGISGGCGLRETSGSWPACSFSFLF